MTRHGYVDLADLDHECEDEDCTGACLEIDMQERLRSPEGQAMLRELLSALDAMPTRELYAELVQREDGSMCALGALAAKKGADLSWLRDEDGQEFEEITEEDTEMLAEQLGIPDDLACEVTYQNDDGGAPDETPAKRWERMRRWCVRNIGEEAKADG